MQVSSLINGFTAYLEGLSETSGKNYNIGSSNVSIFMYSTEFKNYIADELNVDSSIFTKSISDILSMDVVNGKLVEKEEDSIAVEDETETTEVASETEESEPNEQAIAGEMVEILNNLFADQDVIASLDADGSGDLDKAEISTFLESIKGFDGNAEDISLDDIFSGINKIKEDSVIEQPVEETPVVEDTQPVENTPAPQAPSSPSNIGGSNGGSFNPSVPSSGSTSNVNAGDSVDEIKSQIADKNSEIDTVNSDAADQIAEQEEAKKQAMEEAGVSEEEYNEYLEKEQEIESQIEDVEKSIDEKDNEIRDIESTISSNENYISSLEAQISANESKKVPSDQEGAAERNAEIDAMNASIREQIAEIEAENERLEQQKTEAEQAKTDLEAQKEQLEAEKQELLTTTLDNSENFQDSAEVREQIAQFDENIKQIRAQKDEKIAGIKDDIQALEVKLKDAEALEERTQQLQDLSFKSGLGLTGEELVDVARQMLQKYGSSTGYCATGVSRTFEMAYGLSLHGNGCDWTANMDQLVKDGAFVCVTGDYPSSADLRNLPAGAVVTWDSTGGTNGGGAQYGHVTIADGKGGEISDHYAQNIYTSIGGRSDTYHVYLPVV